MLSESRVSCSKVHNEAAWELPWTGEQMLEPAAVTAHRSLCSDLKVLQNTRTTFQIETQR